jgi:hypothetical protein
VVIVKVLGQLLPQHFISLALMTEYYSAFEVAAQTSEAFLAELVADFEAGGRAAIERCRLERLDVYVRVVAPGQGAESHR